MSSLPPAPPTAVLAQQLRQAAQWLQQGQTAAAGNLLGSVARQFPDSPDAHYLLGVSASLLGQPDAALASLQRAIQLNRGNATYHLQAGMVLDALGRHAESAKHYREALRLNPKLPEAHYNLGLALQQQGDLDGAARGYQNAVLQRPQFVEALNNLGNVQLARGKHDDALRALQSAISVRPEFHIPYNNLGNTLIKLKRRDEALRAFRKALELAPNFTEALGNLADQLHQQGDNAEAAQLYTRLLALQPDNANARFALAALNNENPPAPPDSFVRKVFDELAPEFDQHLVATLGYDIPKLLIAELKPWLDARKPVTVLDMGCGTGLFGVEVKPWARQLTGIDLAPQMVARAKERGVYDAVQEAELASHLAQCADASLDLVTATDVFVYVGDLMRIFAEVQRVLKPGGRFAFSVERSDSGDYVLLPTSRYAHSRAYVEALAKQHGFSVVTDIDTPIRKEKGVPLAGDLFVLERS